MKKLILCTLSIFTLFIVAFNIIEKETVIIGKVDISKNVADEVGILYFKLKQDTTFLTKTFLQNDRFKMNVNKKSSYDLFYYSISTPDTYIQTINTLNKDTLFLTINIPNKYQMSADKIICPKCKKHDQILPISYGLKTKTIYVKVKENGDTAYIPEDVKEYDGGCVSSEISAKYHCKRDSINF